MAQHNDHHDHGGSGEEIAELKEQVKQLGLVFKALNLRVVTIEENRHQRDMNKIYQLAKKIKATAAKIAAKVK